jgi:tetratricopeptide (TPR) repeat protein
MSVENELQRAEELLRAGFKTQAQTRLARLLKQDFHNEQAWWLLAQSQDDPQRRKDCLERVLALNPGNQAARQMLAGQAAPAAPPSAPSSPTAASFEPPQLADSPTRAAPEPVKFSSLLNPLTAPSEPEAPAQTEAEAEEVAADRLSLFEREPEPESVESQYSYRYKNTWQPPDEAEADGAQTPAPVAPPDPAHARAEVERAVALIEKGQREDGRAILETLVEADPKNETAWLWLAAITRDREMKLGYLDKALAANPQSKPARKMLAGLGVRVEASGAVARGAGVSLPWYEVWLTALTRPNPESYEVLLSDPEVSVSRALIWAALSGVVIGGIVVLAQSLVFNSVLGALPPDQLALLNSLNPTTLLAVAFLCGLPLIAFGGMLNVLITAGLTHLGARLFGGNRPFTEQAYLTAAYSSPVTILSTVLGLIPLINCLTLPLGLYSLYLNVVSAKAINRFGWGAATFAGLLPVLVGLGLSVCTWVIVFAAAGSGAFDDLLRQLLLPAPGAP